MGINLWLNLGCTIGIGCQLVSLAEQKKKCIKPYVNAVSGSVIPYVLLSTRAVLTTLSAAVGRVSR